MCGKLGHVHRDCDSQTEDSSNLPFGHWLRASSITGEKKSKPNRSNSTTSGASPSAVHQNSDDIKALTTPPRLTLQPIGSESSREISKTDENLLLACPEQPITLAVSDKPTTVKMRRDCTEQEPMVDNVMQITSNLQKKKWKRMARAGNKTTQESSELSESMNKGKREMNDQQNIEGAKRQLTSMVLELFHTPNPAAAAEQPCHGQ